MGRRSVREDKNIYQKARESNGLTRLEAAELLEYISEDKIEKIESGKALPRPEEVMTMAKAYKTPELCNYYCSHECPIGEKYVAPAEVKDLSQITLEMLATLNTLNVEKNRLIEITVDGKITEEELDDFERIRTQLAGMASAISSLSLWVDKALESGKIEK
jgi:transcriptional regulator with XRE-family HTH domain